MESTRTCWMVCLNGSNRSWFGGALVTYVTRPTNGKRMGNAGVQVRFGNRRGERVRRKNSGARLALGSFLRRVRFLTGPGTAMADLGPYFMSENIDGREKRIFRTTVKGCQLCMRCVHVRRDSDDTYVVESVFERYGPLVVRCGVSVWRVRRAEKGREPPACKFGSEIGEVNGIV